MSIDSFKLKYLNCDPHHSYLKEYDIILDDNVGGALAFYVSDGVGHIYNVYLDDEYRGNGIFRHWLKKTFKSVVAYDVLVKKEAYWAGLGEYKLHPHDKEVDFEDIHFTLEELTDVV